MVIRTGVIIIYIDRSKGISRIISTTVVIITSNRSRYTSISTTTSSSFTLVSWATCDRSVNASFYRVTRILSTSITITTFNRIGSTASWLITIINCTSVSAALSFKYCANFTTCWVIGWISEASFPWPLRSLKSAILKSATSNNPLPT